MRQPNEGLFRLTFIENIPFTRNQWTALNIRRGSGYRAIKFINNLRSNTSFLHQKGRPITYKRLEPIGMERVFTLKRYACHTKSYEFR